LFRSFFGVILVFVLNVSRSFAHEMAFMTQRVNTGKMNSIKTIITEYSFQKLVLPKSVRAQYPMVSVGESDTLFTLTAKRSGTAIHPIENEKQIVILTLEMDGENQFLFLNTFLNTFKSIVSCAHTLEREK
jgi:hypothetical protein